MRKLRSLLRQVKIACGAPLRELERRRAKKTYDSWFANEPNKYLYYGNLGKDEKQYEIRNFFGLALYPAHERELMHDATHPLPFLIDSISKVQSQDVFEHLEIGTIPFIFNEIFRVLKRGGVFRLSLPDYHCELLKKRSVYDYNGNILGDLMMGATPLYDKESGGIQVELLQDGNAHKWFPTYDIVQDLISKSDLINCDKIIFYQCYLNEKEHICNPIPDNEMIVMRSVPIDTRANGKPISIVIDFVK